MNEKTTISTPCWETFEEMKSYAKDVVKKIENLDLSYNDIYTEYFSDFKDCSMLKECIKLVCKFIEYKKDKNKLEEVKLYTSELEEKWGSILNLDINDVQDEVQKKVDIEVEPNDDLQLTFMSTDEKSKEVKSEIASLKRKLKKISITYDSSKTYEENLKNYNEQKLIFDKKAKEQKEIDKLKESMLKLSLEYDETISYEDNKIIFEKAKDKKENPAYKFPFKIYFKGCDIRQLDNIFEDNTEYTVKEICDLMFRHGFREFVGKVDLEYDKDENMFVPNFLSQKHG